VITLQKIRVDGIESARLAGEQAVAAPIGLRAEVLNQQGVG